VRVLASKLCEVKKDVLRLVGELIETSHNHLADAKIKVLFKTGLWDQNGTVTKPTGLSLYLSKYDFVITLNYESWTNMEVKIKYAFMDHLMCYCRVQTDESGYRKYYKAKPDFEGFFGNFERFGYWTQALQTMEAINKQLKLFDYEKMDPIRKAVENERDLDEYFRFVDGANNVLQFPKVDQKFADELQKEMHAAGHTDVEIKVINQ
jgi:hypothetical protein